jgi:hypothetical protein
MATWIINDMRIVSMLQLAGYIVREIGQRQDNFLYETNAPIIADHTGIGLKLEEGTIYVRGTELYLRSELAFNKNNYWREQEAKKIPANHKDSVFINEQQEMNHYIIQDKKILESLKEDGIFFKRINSSQWFIVDVKLEYLQVVRFSNGLCLAQKGTLLYIPGREYISKQDYLGTDYEKDKKIFYKLLN